MALNNGYRADNDNSVVVTIKDDISSAVSFLESVGDSYKTAMKAILRQVGQGAKTEVKKRYTHYLKKGTGTTYKSITSKLTRDGRGVVVGAWAMRELATSQYMAGNGKIKGKGAKIFRTPFRYYAFAHTKGSTVGDPSSVVGDGKPAYHFQVNGKWLSSKGWTYEAKPFVRDPALRYLNSPDCNARISKAIKSELERLRKKAEREAKRSAVA